MPNALKNIKTMMGDSRTRTVLIFTILLLVIGIIFGFLKLSGSSKTSGAPGGSAVGSAPNIESIPGGFDTPESAEYVRLQQQQNQMQAKEASKSGKSAIPTLISSSTLGAQGFQQANAAGNAQGCVAPGTPLYSSACQVIATLGPGGVVQAASANQSVFEEGDIVYGADGKLIGKIGPKGEVLNAQEQVIAYVGADGLVRNEKGEVVGQASQVKEGDFVYGPDGKVLGRVGPNGEVLDAKGRIVGHVGPNGVVKNEKGEAIGQASEVREGALVYGSDGKVLGRVGPNGEVLDAKGRVVGYVGPNGVVKNAKGQVIGEGEGATKKPAKLAVGTPFYNAYGSQVGIVGPNGKFIPVSNAVEQARGASQNTVATAQQKNNASGQLGAAGTLPGAPG